MLEKQNLNKRFRKEEYKEKQKMNNKSKAFNDGYEAAKSGCHINNSYPYERPSYGYWEWLDGYRSYKNKK